MTTQYAKDQPAGFTNRIERVAIIGASGRIGRPISEALLRTGKHTVTAITRKDSDSKLPDGIQVAQVDYDDADSLVAALRGQQMLIISLSVMAPLDTQEKLIRAAAAAGVPHVMPNAWGADVKESKLSLETLQSDRFQRDIRFVEDAGLTWTSLCCSFWYEYSLAAPFAYGMESADKKATLYGDGRVQINTSTWAQCGRAVAAFLSFKALPEDEDDTAPTVSRWNNRPIYISSFLLSQRQMLDSIQRVQKTTDADWDIRYEPVEERYKRGREMVAAGDMVGFGIAMYARTFFPGDAADYENREVMDNDVLGLPKEDLDEATARALAMS